MKYRDDAASEGRGMKVGVIAYTECHSQFHTNRSAIPHVCSISISDTHTEPV